MVDKVRFGRALGYGARHAAKALVQAADAATSREGNSASAPRTVSPDRPIAAREPAANTRQTARVNWTGAPIARARKAAGPSFLHPLKRYSGTVLLQVVGTFFAVFALLMGQTAWKLRDGLHERWQNMSAQHFWLSTGLFLLFSWFALSSFLRAKHLGKS